MTTAQLHDEHLAIWSAARAEANLAYAAWCELPGLDSYAVYRAAEDGGYETLVRDVWV